MTFFFGVLARTLQPPPGLRQVKDVEAVADTQPPDCWTVGLGGYVSRHLPIQRTINDLW